MALESTKVVREEGGGVDVTPHAATANAGPPITGHQTLRRPEATAPNQAGASQRQRVVSTPATIRPAQQGGTRADMSSAPPPPPARRSHAGRKKIGCHHRRRHHPPSAARQDQRRQDGTSAPPSVHADRRATSRQDDGTAATTRPAQPGRTSADRTPSPPPPPARRSQAGPGRAGSGHHRHRQPGRHRCRHHPSGAARQDQSR